MYFGPLKLYKLTREKFGYPKLLGTRTDKFLRSNSHSNVQHQFNSELTWLINSVMKIVHIFLLSNDIFLCLCVCFFGLSHLPPGVKQQTKVRFTDVVLAEVALKHFSTHAPQAIRTIIRT